MSVQILAGKSPYYGTSNAPLHLSLKVGKNQSISNLMLGVEMEVLIT